MEPAWLQAIPGNFAMDALDDQDVVFPCDDSELLRNPEFSLSLSLPDFQTQSNHAWNENHVLGGVSGDFANAFPMPSPNQGHRPPSPWPGNPPDSHRRRVPPRRQRSQSRYSSNSLAAVHNATPRPIPTARHSEAPPGVADSQDPLQRWRNSPPSEEPASFVAIHRALQNADQSRGHSFQSRHASDHSSASRHSIPMSGNKSLSAASSSSGASSASSRASRTRLTHQYLRARGRAAAHSRSHERQFPCTFCCDTFRSKHDWARHEKALHLSTEEWLCAPYGGVVLSSSTSRLHCAFCDMLDPSLEHLNLHHFNTCRVQSCDPPRYRRKDHLTQHLRLVHKLESMPLIDSWKVTVGNITSRCGFCGTRMGTWDERTMHLAEHFRQGRTMKDWTGDHDFDPQIAAMVTNALPPYLIHSESQCVVPFSSTDGGGTRDHFDQICSQIRLDDPDSWRDQDRAGQPSGTSTVDSSFESAPFPPPRVFVDALCFYLSRYAKRQMELGVVPTDAMMQEESRRIIYSCDDGWNQTVADNPEWLANFRRRFSFTGSPGA